MKLNKYTYLEESYQKHRENRLLDENPSQYVKEHPEVMLQVAETICGLLNLHGDCKYEFLLSLDERELKNVFARITKGLDASEALTKRFKTFKESKNLLNKQASFTEKRGDFSGKSEEWRKAFILEARKTIGSVFPLGLYPDPDFFSE